MPLYEYQCSKCKGVFEVIQKFADAPIRKHKGCGGRVERLVSAPGLHFKGTGWYVTDYARNAGGKDKDQGKAEGSGEKPAAESKSEAKPDSASEPKPPSKNESRSESRSESKPGSKPAPSANTSD